MRQRSAETYAVVAADVERLESRALLTFTYSGGALLTNVQVQNVYLGGDWNNSKILGQIEQKLDSFAGTMVSGNLTDGLTAAGYNVYRGSTVPSVVGNFTLDKSFPDGNNPYTGGLADDPTQVGFSQSIQGLLQTMVTSGQLTNPTNDTLYCVYVEPGVTVTDASGADSIFFFGGYHGAFAGTNAAGNGQNIRYAVMPFPGFPNNPANSTSITADALNQLTVVASHEISEAVTNPDVTFVNQTGDLSFSGWYDFDNNGEVGDLSQNFTTISQGYLVQLMEGQNNLVINPNAVSHTLGVPTSLVLSNITTTTAQLSWNGAPLAQGYRIFSVNGSQLTLVGTVSSSTTTFSLTGLTPGSSASFVVQAFNGPSTASSAAATATIPLSGSAVPATSGAYVINYTNPAGAAVQIIQNGNTLTFVDKFGNSSPGYWVSPTRVYATAWGYGATIAGGTVAWDEGTVWSEKLSMTGTKNGSGKTSITATGATVSVVDYYNPNHILVHAVQTGTNRVVFVDSLGNMVLGTFLNSTQAIAPGYGNLIATFGANTVSWSDGSSWSLTASTPSNLVVTNYTNSNGVPVHSVQNGTANVAFIDGMGQTSLGKMLTATTGMSTLYPTILATFGANGNVQWQDGGIWTKTATAPPMVTFIDTTGSVFHVQLTSLTTLVVLDGSNKGLTATRVGNTLKFSNNVVWDNFNSNDLDTFFQMTI